MSSTLTCPEATPARAPERGGLRSQRLESIGMLTSGIAHDLKNILAPIVLAAPMLRERATNPEDLRLIASLEKSAERGVELVHQILSYAHGQEGDMQVVDAVPLLQEIITGTGETLPKNIRLVTSIPHTLWPIRADPTQLHQVLLNLCVNARDAMPGGGTLSVSAENCVLTELEARAVDGARAGSWVALQVEDTGTGIPAELLNRIWEPFFTTKDARKGTGLGLYTVRNIVESHNGFVTLRTEPGRGTAFRVHLPAARGSEPVVLQQPTPVPSYRGHGELIMVVDDEPQIREMTAAMLTRNGYRVITAGDGAEAVASLATRGQEVQVLITDLKMPNLDGAALADIARHLNPRIKVMAVSGASSFGRGSGAKIERFGGSFLFKPFKVQALLEAVHQLLNKGPVAEVA